MNRVLILLCVQVIALALCVTCAADDRSLLLDWNFGEGQGTTANDSSGCGSDGDMRNCEWAKDQSGRSCLLFSKDGSVSTPMTETPRAIELLVNPSTSGVRMTLAHCARPWSGIWKNFQFSIAILKNGTLQVIVGGGKNDDTVAVLESGRVVSLNRWTQIVFTYDEKTINLYINGMLDKSIGYNFQVVEPKHLTIGASYDDYMASVITGDERGDPEKSKEMAAMKTNWEKNNPGKPYHATPYSDQFVGAIATVRLWDRTLGNSDVANLYQAFIGASTRLSTTSKKVKQ